VDYRNRAEWLAALKPLSTEAGYTLLETALAPAAWPKLTQAQAGKRHRPNGAF